MNWTKDDDGSLVSSLLFFSIDPSVIENAETCKHKFVKNPKLELPEPEDEHKDCKIAGESCLCGAVRYRVTGPEDQINHLFHL